MITEILMTASLVVISLSVALCAIVMAIDILRNN